jgi:hypothetical protein
MGNCRQATGHHGQKDEQRFLARLIRPATRYRARHRHAAGGADAVHG